MACVTRGEQFDADREAEALARFDELTAGPSGRRIPSRREARRRVRPNAATASADRFEAAIAARDIDAIAAHARGQRRGHGPYHRRDLRPARHRSHTWRALLRAQDGTYRHEPLATLGDSLALCRVSTSASGAAGKKFDVGAYEIETIILIEVDAQGRRRWTEVFAADRLGDAVVRLYERYAELLPDGPERDRAAATARSVATLLGPLDLDRWATAFAPRRRVRRSPDRRDWGPCAELKQLLRGIRALLELVDDVAYRVDDILDLRSDALLVRWTNFGTDRAGGGAFERPSLLTLDLRSRWPRDALGAVRRRSRSRGARPLRRADGGTPTHRRIPRRERRARRVRANAATAQAARLDAAVAARDAEAFPALLADVVEAVHHPTGVVYDRDGVARDLALHAEDART